MKNILLIGSGAREHAIANAIHRSTHPHTLYCFGTHKNPGILPQCDAYAVGDLSERDAIVAFAKQHHIHFAVIGPEAALAAGVVDALEEAGISAVGPSQAHARIETSKGFARQLLTDYQIPGCPTFQHFKSRTDIPHFLNYLQNQYVIKADGLMGGKGVKVAGDHLHSHQEALDYCDFLLSHQQGVVIEEKLIGEEFSLLSFTDGVHIQHLPIIQDHKRAHENDTGPNTGGMGTYTDANHLLPFLTSADVKQAQAINTATIRALHQTLGTPYRGILYGGFMATRTGVSLIEYNARFGDPEALNLLTLLQTDFIEICEGILNNSLDQINLSFSKHASVCKYLVPDGYPDHPIKNETILIHNLQHPDLLFYGAVEQTADRFTLLGSRAVALVGLGETIERAEQAVEQEIPHIQGPLFHRKDIGTRALISKRCNHMSQLRHSGTSS